MVVLICRGLLRGVDNVGRRFCSDSLVVRFYENLRDEADWGKVMSILEGVDGIKIVDLGTWKLLLKRGGESLFIDWVFVSGAFFWNNGFVSLLSDVCFGLVETRIILIFEWESGDFFN